MTCDCADRLRAEADRATERRDLPLRAALPNPGRTENGYVYCNEPLVIQGVTVGHCVALVKPDGTRFRRPRWHKGPHRIEWGSA